MQEEDLGECREQIDVQWERSAAMEEVAMQQEGCGKIQLELGVLSSQTEVIENAVENAAGRNKTFVLGAAVQHSAAVVCMAKPEDRRGVVDATRMSTRQIDHACRDHTVSRCVEVSDCAETSPLYLSLGPS